MRLIVKFVKTGLGVSAGFSRCICLFRARSFRFHGKIGGSTPSRDRSVRVRGERDRRGRERPVFRTHEIGGRHGLERQIVDELPPCTSLQWRKLAAVNLLDHFDFVMSPIGGVGKAEADHKAVRCGFGIAFFGCAVRLRGYRS